MTIKVGRIKKKNATFILGLIVVILVLINVLGLLILFTDNDDKKIVDSNQDTLELDESFEIKTKYCNLYFPKEFDQNVEIKYSEVSTYKVEFYGLVNEKEAKHIFDVCFNSDDGFLLGYLENDDEIINISIDLMELTFDESWTQEEMNLIYSMQEEMNYVMDSLKKIGNYVEP